MDTGDYLTTEAELTHYQHHENNPNDMGYRHWLAQLGDEMLAVLDSSLKEFSHGLDYGSGPGPTLSLMIAEAGHTMSIYDPFFAPNKSVLETTYDFITCTETAEHFHQPLQEFNKLNDLLKPDGWLGVMTQILDRDELFADWWYVRDPTHVAFYKTETMHYLADRFGWKMMIPRKNVVLFQKTSAS
jgi:hypothetical protein